MKKKQRITDWDLKAQTVAWLLTEGKKKQKEIAKELDVSPATVARLTKMARDNKWLVTTCDLTDEQKQKVNAQLPSVTNDLHAKLESIAKAKPNNPFRVEDIRIFDSKSEAIGRKDHEARLQRFGAAAATRLMELLPKMKKVGITWGKTIACLIESLGPLQEKVQKPTIEKTFVPLSGVLLNDPSIDLSSTSLVARLHFIVNRQSHGAVSLGAAPARIPFRFQADKERLRKGHITALTALANDILGYRKVFLGWKDEEGSHPPLVNQLDSLITSVGCDYSESHDPWLDEMSTREELSRDQLDRLAVGDIGGVFLSRRDPEPGSLKDINARWKGVQMRHFEHCARNAAREKTPGVILVAVGSRKAKIVAECIRKQLVNQLIIDHDLAQAIVELDPPA